MQEYRPTNLQHDIIHACPIKKKKKKTKDIIHADHACLRDLISFFFLFLLIFFLIETDILSFEHTHQQKQKEEEEEEYNMLFWFT